MNRLIAFGLGLAWAGIAAAQPMPLPGPASKVQTAPPAATLMPPSAVGSTTPTVPPAGHPGAACATCQPGYGVGFGDAGCGTPLFPGVGPKPGDRTNLNRFLDWACYRPGPAVLPLFTPTPFHAPLRTYFPCKPDAGCAPACTAPTAPAAPAPKVGFKFVNAPETECRKPLLQASCSPRFGNGGLMVRSPACSPAQGPACYGSVPRPVPLLSGCQTCGPRGGFCATGFGRIGSVFDNVLSCFSPGRCGSAGGTYGGEMGTGCAGANCYPTGVPGPTLGGYRLANPVGYPAPMGAYPASQTPGYQQQIAAVPFTNP